MVVRVVKIAAAALIAFSSVTTAAAITSTAPQAVRTVNAGAATDPTPPGDVTWGH